MIEKTSAITAFKELLMFSQASVRMQNPMIHATVTNSEPCIHVQRLSENGLRVSEVVSLRPENLERDRGMMRIDEGKGLKDRYTLLSKTAVAIVDKYLNTHRIESKWLFPGQDPKAHLSKRSAENVFKNALETTKIKKDCSIHALRHAFATHLLDHGCNIRYVQELVGHASIRTTEIYLHVTNEQLSQVESPLDAIFRKKEESKHRTNGARGSV